MSITKEDIIYNKAFLAKGYIKLGKYSDGYNLLKKIETEVSKPTEITRKTISKVAEAYMDLGLSEQTNRLYNDLKDGKWGTCEEKLLQKIKPKGRKIEIVINYAPAPEPSSISELKEEKYNIGEQVTLARFYFERRNSRYIAYNMLCDLINKNKEVSFNSRKVMLQAAQLYEKLGLSEIKRNIERDLKEGKWGTCEEQILNKITKEEKKDLWDKTKELVKKKVNVAPIPECTIPSILMMKL